MNVNKCLFGGRLTRDVELKFLASGTAVASISLAINRRYKNASGEPQEEVTYLDFEAFGKTAEVMNQYLKKGSGVFIESRARLESWQDKEGKNRSKIKFVIESFEFLDGKKDDTASKTGTTAANFPKSGGTRMRVPETIDDEPSF